MRKQLESLVSHRFPPQLVCDSSIYWK